MADVILPINEATQTVNNLAVFVPVSAVFPECEATPTELIQQLAKLSRTEALIWCARLNLVVSNATWSDVISRQAYCIKAVFSPAEVEHIDRFVAARGGPPESTRIFLRAQLIDLMRWIAAYCVEMPGDGTTFERAEVRSAFGKAALIVSELWGDRAFRDKIVEGMPVTEETRKRALGALRIAADAASSGIGPMMAIGRGREVFCKHMPRFCSSIHEDFQTAAGINLATFYGVVAVIAVHFLCRAEHSNGVSEEPGVFLKAAFSRYAVLASSFDKYARFACQTEEEFSASARQDIESDAGLNSSQSLSLLRRKPILCTRDGRHIVLDPVFFEDHAAVGPLFAIANRERTRQNEYFATFGESIESYTCDLMRRMYPRPAPPLADRLQYPVIGRSADGSDVEIADISLVDGPDIVLFEVKAVWIRDQDSSSSDPDDYWNTLTCKYASTEVGTSRVKGVTQIARNIENLVSGTWSTESFEVRAVRAVFPVLICHDPLIETGVHPSYLAKEFARALSPDRFAPDNKMIKGGLVVANLVVMSLNTLEILETSIEKFSLANLLRDYLRDVPDCSVGLHNYIAMSPYKNKIFASTNLAASAKQAIEMARQLMTD
ncbi:MAG: hypothetical protein AB7O59_13475 [Pirellulales bacterium]